MNFNHLRYFLKTAEYLNYTKAAEELLIARQSLRQAISSLEEEVGKPLFVNVRNKLTLTEYGSYLTISGQKVLQEYEKMEEGIRRLVQGSSNLKIAYSQSLFPFILPNTEKILKSFKTRFPDIDLQMVIMDNDTVISSVVDGTIDVGCVLQFPCQRKNCRMIKMTEFEVALDYNLKKPFGEKRYISPKDMRDVSFVGFGSLQTTMQPLWEECVAEDIRFPYQVLPDALDAFYHVNHGLAVGFDILTPEVPSFSWEKTSVLSGYKWELGFLCSNQYGDPGLIDLFCQYMKQEYDRQREKQRL